MLRFSKLRAYSRRAIRSRPGRRVRCTLVAGKMQPAARISDDLEWPAGPQRATWGETGTRRRQHCPTLPRRVKRGLLAPGAAFRTFPNRLAVVEYAVAVLTDAGLIPTRRNRPSPTTRPP